MTVFVAVDIGCIECGEPSAVLGIFEDAEEANRVLDAAAEEQERNWRGQHSFKLFEVEK